MINVKCLVYICLLVSVSLFVSFDGLVVLSRSCVQIWLFADIYLLYVLDTILCEFEVSLSVTLLEYSRAILPRFFVAVFEPFISTHKL